MWTALHARTRQMVTTAASVEWTVVQTEVEALQLEYTWIKEFEPRFNVRYRDDKSYPSLAVTLYEEFPRLQVMRGPKRKGVRYFGPYSHAWAIRETLDLLLRVFPARTCSAGVFKRAGQIGRPCLLGYIGKCKRAMRRPGQRGRAPPHRRRLLRFHGRQDRLMIKRLQRQMAEASAQLEFERAARLRDDLDALRRAMEKQAVVFADGTDADVVAFAQDDLEAAVQVFHVRGGRVRGERGWTIDKAATVDGTSGVPELVEQFVTQFYGSSGDVEGAEGGGMDGAGIPREILVPELPANADVLAEWLCAQRGSRVSLRVPQRGDKRALMETVARNAAQAFAQHKLRRASDLTARSQALSELSDALGLAEAPLRIECFDVSHVQGTNVVASMVVFEDGAAPQERVSALCDAHRGWRHRLDRRGGPAAIRPVSRCAGGRRRAGRRGPDAEAAARGGIDPETGRPRKFAYPPNLVVVDGGAPQVAAAQAVLDDLGVDDVALIGLAKRLEEVWLPREPYPVILPRSSEGLYLLQRVRDEAHRFAITFHRQRRSKAMTMSVLDGIPGLGATRRKALVARFGSLKRLRAASMTDLLEVPGIGPQTAEAIQAALAADRKSREPAVNVTTGEVLEIEEADDTGDGSG